MRKVMKDLPWYSLVGLVALLGALIVTCLRKSSEERFVQVAEETLPKTVMIQAAVTVEMRGMKLSGTVRGAGVFISPNGHVLTAAHLLWADEVGDVTICDYLGDCRKGELLFQYDRFDLALFKIETSGTTPFAKLADPRSLKVGQEVLAIGNPLGFEWSVSHGIISALYRDDTTMYNMTQSDAFINPGNSGGPLFDIHGKLVGINSRIYPPVNAPVFTGIGMSAQVGQIIEFLARFRGLEVSQ